MTTLFRASGLATMFLVITALAPPATAAEPKIVEESMHELMEYIFQPAYKRLKVAMATEPADRPGWRGVKSDALILAEGTNLLLMREPDEGSQENWNKHSVATREAGAAFYAAAKKSDFAAARQHYEAMLQHCNACHKEFEEGKHILAP